MSDAIAVSPADALGRGWSVIPCGVDKKPLIGTWKPFQTRRPTEQELSNWGRLNPAGWAIITGAISARVTLDFDGEAGCNTLATLGLKAHRATPSGGFHVDFKHPGWRVPTLNHKSKPELGRLWPGLDIRADGGYVLFTGRIPRGEYVWLRDPAPFELDILPEDLRDFLGLLNPPEVIAPKLNLNGKTQIHQNGRVDADTLTRRALDRAPAEGRNNAGLWLATQLRDNRYSQAETGGIMRGYVARVGNTNTKGEAEPYTEAEALATAREAFSNPAREPWGAKGTNSGSTARVPLAPEDEASATPDLLYFPFTDTGNAERLVALCGRDIRFCMDMDKWFAWDGRRWIIDNGVRVRRLAKRTMRQMYLQAAEIEEKEHREAAEKHARKSESSGSVDALLKQAKSEEYEGGSIDIKPSEMDTDPYLLNCLNGTLDPRTGVLRSNRREDFITKMVHFEYRPEAKCPQFMRFLYRIMGDGPDASDQERGRADRLVSYLQKCFGYALTADVIEKAVFCFFGSGNNGKTTLLEIIRFILSEYSTQVLIDNLMMHHNRESNASLADLADLRGARFVTTSETEEGQRLALSKLKYLTQGMGGIKTCRKYENHITFPATHKLFLDANHKPVVRGADRAVWNRLKPIPFIVTIPPEEIDTGLLDTLKREAVGILAWMVKGCQRWTQEGLGDPPEVAEASAVWQAESDRFPAFLEEKCVLAPEAWLPVALLWPAYQNWCEENNERNGMTKTSFDERLEKIGCWRARDPSGDKRAWIGIRFRTAQDE